jgi:hypothetical protein
VEDDLALLVRDFEASEQASQAGRADSEQARDYYDGKQLSDAELRALRKRKQPPVVINRIQRKIDYLRGLERQTRTDPKAWPRTVQHTQDADSATDALRYAAADQNIDIKRSQVFENMLIEGFGGVEVAVVRGPKGVIDPKVTVIPWDRLFFDPHSSAHDFSDASYLGYVTWMDLQAAKARWPDAADVLDRTIDKPTSSTSDTYDDKPRWTSWYDAKRQRVRVVTMYYKRSEQWNRCEFTLAGHLTPPAPSPWIDEDGQPECGLILQSAYVDRDNDRYGVVRNMISPQDEINKRRSKLLHLLNTTQVQAIDQAAIGEDADLVRKEAARPDGVIPFGYQKVQTADMAGGQAQLLSEAKSEIDLMGPNATMQGKASQDSSGRAILALQQGGMTEMAPLMDNLRHFTIRLYRQVWNRIRQYWTGERWLRVTDDERDLRWSAVNTTRGALAMRKLADALKAGQVDEATARQYEQQIQTDPAMAQPANMLAELDVDIDIAEVQETPTVQAEQFQLLTSLAQAGMPIPPEVIIEASNLRNKDKLLRMLEEAKQAQAQPNPMAEIAQQGAVAEVAVRQSQAQLNQAKARSEMAKPDLEAAKLHHQARHDAMALIQSAQPPVHEFGPPL